MVGPGDQVAYRVAPMVGEADSLEEDTANESPWTDVVEIGATTKGGISCYFNRGIVASQWLSRLLPKADPATELREIIATPGDKTRNFLGGPVRDKLTSLLNDTNRDGGHVFAALFELDDPELIPLLQALEQWKTLVECEDASPASLLTSNATPRVAQGLEGVTLWFTPMHGLLDLEQAGELIRGAKNGILFLMFNPGPRGSLFNDISDLALPGGQYYDPDLYIQGVLNQNPGHREESRHAVQPRREDRGERGRRSARRDSGPSRILAEGTLEAAAHLRDGSQQGRCRRPLRREAGRHDGLAQHGAEGERRERREPAHYRGRQRSGEPVRWQYHADLQPVSLAAVGPGAARQARLGRPR